MAIKIKLMADYACDPLWWSGDGRVGNIDPGTLPLSQETISRLEKWADANDATLNRNDPANSPGFPSQEAEDNFEAEGISLWKQLRQELSPHYEVLYFSDRVRKLLTHPSELEVLV